MLRELGRQDAMLFEPVGVAALLLSVPLAPALFDLTVAPTLAAGVAFLLGWRYRVVGPVFAALLLFVHCYRNSWSMIYHSDKLVVLHVIVFGLASAADAVSVDARRRSPAPAATPARDARAGSTVGPSS